MKTLLVILIIPTFLLGCSDDTTVNGWDTRAFEPHRASSFRQTPDGHLRDAGPFGSVTAGFVTESEIDAAVDAGFRRFAVLFPELSTPPVRVHINDDYVMWVPGAGWAGGVSEGENVCVCLFSRGTSAGDPGSQYIKRAPDGNYNHWRFTSEPLLPALTHELLHSVIGDPFHASAFWNRL